MFVIMVGAANPTGEMNFEDAAPFLAYDYLHKLGYDVKVELLEVK